jgi:predicted SprT family Zn-dependent metalloprotease
MALAPWNADLGLNAEFRQMAFDLDQKPVGKPATEAVDLLIQATFYQHQPGLSLPPVRVSARMRRTLGSYMPSRKQIAISSRLLTMGDENDIREVVLHEVAHAIVHYRWGDKPRAHGREFRSVCKEIGAKPQRFVDVTTDEWQSQIRYLSKCGHCKVLIVRKRRMRSVRCICGLKLYPQLWSAVVPDEGGDAGDWVML